MARCIPWTATTPTLCWWRRIPTDRGPPVKWGWSCSSTSLSSALVMEVKPFNSRWKQEIKCESNIPSSCAIWASLQPSSSLSWMSIATACFSVSQLSSLKGASGMYISSPTCSCRPDRDSFIKTWLRHAAMDIKCYLSCLSRLDLWKSCIIVYFSENTSI